MKITVHRGSNQIGGCVTEYEYNGWKLFVDYGEQLPGVPILDKKLEIEGLTCGDLSKSALLITHYHGDHIGKLSEVAEAIPVYMGYTGCEIYRKLQRRLSYVKGEIGEKARKSHERAGLIHTFMEDEEFSIGPFSIRPVKMDHSAYDSYGFIITDGADESIVFHTGDFRAHGLYGDEFWDTISSLPDADAVVCEATNIERSRDEAEPEWKIEKHFKELFKQNKYNSVFVSSTNIDRIFGIYRAAAEAGRIVLMDEYQYYILNSVIGKNDWMRNETERFEFIDEDGSEVSDTYDLGYEFDKGLPFVLKLDRTVKKTSRFYIPAKLRKLINWKGCVLIARPTTQFESLIESFPAHQSKKYLSQWKEYLNPDSPAYNEGCKVRASTRTPICSQGIAHPAAKFRHTLPVLCVGSPTHRGRLIESQPTLGLRVMSAADKGTTVTAEQSDAPLWSRNLPPQLS